MTKILGVRAVIYKVMYEEHLILLKTCAIFCKNPELHACIYAIKNIDKRIKHIETQTNHLKETYEKPNYIEQHNIKPYRRLVRGTYENIYRDVIKTWYTVILEELQERSDENQLLTNTDKAMRLANIKAVKDTRQIYINRLKG